MSRKPSILWKTFAVPTWIALLTGVGLFAALLGDGIWDALAWPGMGIAAAIGIRGLFKRRS